MTLKLTISQTTEESLIAAFFQASEGNWRSERRYYTLPDGDTKEMVTEITIKFLKQGTSELRQLAQMHSLDDELILICGAFVSWKSTDIVTGNKNSQGSTLFGAKGKILYRDRAATT